MLRVGFSVIAALLLLVAPAQAHSTLENSSPAAGATVTELPKTLSLTFTKAVRLMTLKLIGKDVDMALEVDRSAPAARSFSAPLPDVAPGTYEVKWTATARDGHVMTGSFSFMVEAEGVTKSAPPEKN